MAIDGVLDLVEILREDLLYRRLNLQSHIRKGGQVSPTAYMHNRIPMGEVSVDLARLTSAEDCLRRAKKSGWCLGELEACVPMDRGLQVRHDPKLDPGDFNPAHTLIVGMQPTDMAHCDYLARKTRVLGLPPT